MIDEINNLSMRWAAWQTNIGEPVSTYIEICEDDILPWKMIPEIRVVFSCRPLPEDPHTGRYYEHPSNVILIA